MPKYITSTTTTDFKQQTSSQMEKEPRGVLNKLNQLFSQNEPVMGYGDNVVVPASPPVLNKRRVVPAFNSYNYDYYDDGQNNRQNLVQNTNKNGFQDIGNIDYSIGGNIRNNGNNIGNNGIIGNNGYQQQANMPRQIRPFVNNNIGGNFGGNFGGTGIGNGGYGNTGYGNTGYGNTGYAGNNVGYSNFGNPFGYLNQAFGYCVEDTVSLPVAVAAVGGVGLMGYLLLQQVWSEGGRRKRSFGIEDKTSDWYTRGIIRSISLLIFGFQLWYTWDDTWYYIQKGT